MADDPYSVLGVAKTASAADITKAYRKLAKKLHPDLNPGDKAAEEKFKQITAAYDIIGDEEKRGRYDRGEIDAGGQERPQQRYYREYAGGEEGARYRSTAGYEDIGAFSDLFGDLFGERGGMRGGAGGRRFSMRGQDAQYRLDVDFLDAVNGTKTRITLPDGGTLDVTIPPGVTDGQVLRLKGKGNPGMGEGGPGDALIEISGQAASGVQARGRRYPGRSADHARRGGARRQGRGADRHGPRVRHRAAGREYRADAEAERPRREARRQLREISSSSSAWSCPSASMTISRPSPRNGARATATIRDGKLKEQA